MSVDAERVAAVLLAAGASRRFGSPKMLAAVGGEPLVRRVARSFVAAGFGEVAVVLAPGAREVASALDGLGVLLVTNPRPEDGMLSSAQAGLAALPATRGRAAVSPADLPGLTASVLARLLAALPAEEPAEVVVPSSGGRRGHPLVLPAALVPRLLAWEPGRRLSDLLREPDVRVRELSGFGPEVLRDVDVPADLDDARG
jgi:molybdenum cofactor cytidylyltransferase